jgi:hypothetical protein
MGTPIKTSMDRLYSIAIGGFVAVIVNVLVFPMWAGEQLHKELVDSFTAVADSLEGNIIIDRINIVFHHTPLDVDIYLQIVDIQSNMI